MRASLSVMNVLINRQSGWAPPMFVLLFACTSFAAHAQASADPLAPLKRLAGIAADVDDYTLHMDRDHRHDDPSDDMEPATVLVKHRREPACVYMRWIEKPHKGREMLYCSDKYDGKIQVHEGGFLGMVTITMDPKKESSARGLGFRSPDEIGLFGLSRMVDDVRERGLSPQTSVRTINEAEATCLRFDGGAEVPRRFEVGARELCVETESGLPVGLRLWSPDGTLMEDSRFSMIMLDAGLTDLDFDKSNPDYDF